MRRQRQMEHYGGKISASLRNQTAGERSRHATRGWELSCTMTLLRADSNQLLSHDSIVTEQASGWGKNIQSSLEKGYISIG